MPALFVRTPRNLEFISKFGTYKTHLNMQESRETAVQRQLRRGGLKSYEMDVQAAFYAFCEIQASRLVVYDIGAHIGLYSATITTLFRSLNPYLIAFEPSPRTANIARTIRDANGLSYSVIEEAVSSQNGTMKLYISPVAETSNSLNPTFRKGDTDIDITVTTIDRIYEGGAPPPTLVKIDVETLEYAVVLGGLATLVEHKPVIICELLRASDRQLTGAMLSALEWIGYEFYRIESSGKLKMYSAHDVMENLSGKYRDWVLTPNGIPAEFETLFEQWRSSLNECDETTNLLVKPGEEIPEDTLSDW